MTVQTMTPINTGVAPSDAMPAATGLADTVGDAATAPFQAVFDAVEMPAEATPVMDEAAGQGGNRLPQAALVKALTEKTGRTGEPVAAALPENGDETAGGELAVALLMPVAQTDAASRSDGSMATAMVARSPDGAMVGARPLLAETRKPVEADAPVSALDGLDLSAGDGVVETLSDLATVKAAEPMQPGQKGTVEAMLSALEQNVAGSSNRHGPVDDNVQMTPSPLPSVTTSSTPTTASHGVHQAFIADAPGQPEWNQSLSRQIVWMSHQHIRQAEIRLNPANLGTVEVRLKMEDDNVSVAFASHHGLVRDAIEQALPRLQAMMEDQGLQLVDSQVSDQSFAGAESDDRRAVVDDRPGSGTKQGDADNASGTATVTRRLTAAEAMVDYYI